MTAVILLAAGLSSRFGSPKALVDLGGEPLIARLQKTYLAALVDEIIVVLGASANDIKPYILNHKKVKVVYNKHYKLGQTSSFQAGLNAVGKSVQGIYLQPVDYPWVKRETINALREHFYARQPEVIVPVYGGHKGHPPIFHASLRKELTELDVGQGLNVIAQRHQAETSSLPVNDPGVTATFNTVEEFQKQRSMF